jgi:hypothetical protein
VISIARKTLGVLVIKPAKGGAQLSVNAAGNPSQIKVRLDIARQGPPGEAAIGVGSFTHTQTVAASSWTVNHNLGYRPAIQALSVGGQEFWGEVLHVSTNQAVLYFDSPSSGLAICS